MSKKLDLNRNDFVSVENEKYPYLEFFWSVFSRIRTEYGDLLCKSEYSVQGRENTDQKTPNAGTFHVVITVTKSPAFVWKGGMVSIFVTGRSRFKNNSKISSF